MRTSFGALDSATGKEPVSISGRKRNPQTTAWIVLSLAFAAFWLLVVGASLGGKHYYDTAALPTNATLSIEEGIVLFRDAVTSTLISASDNLELREGDEVLVGQGARASLRLFDGSAIRLYSGSDLTLKELRKSQFHDGFQHIGLQLKKGTARLLIGEQESQVRRFSAATPFGTALLGVGNFGLEVTDTQARISSRSGDASVTAPGESAYLTAGKRAILSPAGVAGPMPEGDPLVRNGDFSQGFSEWGMLDLNEPGRPEELGQRLLATEKIAGRDSTSLRMSRQSPRGAHGETGLFQIINKDVSDYQTLKMRANVKVTGQSLSGGGYMGYEYPLMIRVRYRDATGGQIDWTHGFFATNPEGRPTPNGEQVPRGEWVPYDGDLMQVSPTPVYVISVEVLGAGHTFDGSIANLEMVGR